MKREDGTVITIEEIKAWKVLLDAKLFKTASIYLKLLKTNRP